MQTKIVYNKFLYEFNAPLKFKTFKISSICTYKFGNNFHPLPL